VPAVAPPRGLAPVSAQSARDVRPGVPSTANNLNCGKIFLLLTITQVKFARKKNYFNRVTVFHFCVQNFVESTGITVVNAKISM
jgi:hypothetical protein